MITPDIKINVKFYKTEENGRKSPTSSDYFGTIFVIGSDYHDCRLFLNETGSILPGDCKFNVPVKFLCWDLVFPKLKIGSKFHLWDGRNIAEGEVSEIINPDPRLTVIK